MIIDSHTHTFPASMAPQVIANLQQKASSVAYTEGTDAALRQSMRVSGIDCSILLPVMTHPKQVTKLNDIAIQKNEAFSDTGLFSLGGMHPDFEDYGKELERIARHGITGIKLHPAYQGTDLDDVRFLRIIEKAAQCHLAIVVHAGWDIGIMHRNFACVAHIQTVLKEISPPKLVLAHMGGWKDWDTVEKELCGENVYFDTSFSLGAYEPPKGVSVPPAQRRMLGKEQFCRIVGKHGFEKILFGSDSPWSDQANSIAQIKACGFGENANESIFHKNAQNVFHINK
ncbi:MAG: amidohydrolase family protein [Clostridia bacterium]|nr:amidohydrolase family protein [Clostridia bacterium]